MLHVKKLLISGFIITCCLTMIRGQIQKKTAIDSYLTFLNLTPKTKKLGTHVERKNIFISADVEFMDGSKQTYFFPNAMNLNASGKYYSANKFEMMQNILLNASEDSVIFRDASKYILRKIKDGSSDKIPLKVHLNKHWEEVKDIKTEFRSQDFKDKNYHKFSFYTYEVLK